LLVSFKNHTFHVIYTWEGAEASISARTATGLLVQNLAQDLHLEGATHQIHAHQYSEPPLLLAMCNRRTFPIPFTIYKSFQLEGGYLRHQLRPRDLWWAKQGDPDGEATDAVFLFKVHGREQGKSRLVHVLRGDSSAAPLVDTECYLAFQPLVTAAAQQQLHTCNAWVWKGPHSSAYQQEVSDAIEHAVQAQGHPGHGLLLHLARRLFGVRYKAKETDLDASNLNVRFVCNVLKTMGHASRQTTTPTRASTSAPAPSSQTLPRMPPAAPPKPPKPTLAVANEGGAAAAAAAKKTLLPPAPPPKPGAKKLPPAPPPKPLKSSPLERVGLSSATAAPAPAAASSSSSASSLSMSSSSTTTNTTATTATTTTTTTTRTTLSEFGLDAVSIPGFVEPTRPARLFCVSRAKMDVGGMFVEEMGPSQTFTQRDLYLHARNTFVLDTGGSAIFVWYPSSDLDGQDVSLGLTVASRYRRAVPSLSYYVEGKSAELLQTEEGRAKFAGLNRVAHSSRASDVRKTVPCPALRVALVDDGEEPLLFKQSFCGWSSAMATPSTPKGYASKYAQSLQHEEAKTAADIAMDEAAERNPGTQPESSEKHHDDSEPSSPEFRKRRASRLVRGNSQGKILSLSQRISSGVLPSLAER
jgi:hypothetical protein